MRPSPAPEYPRAGSAQTRARWRRPGARTPAESQTSCGRLVESGYEHVFERRLNGADAHHVEARGLKRVRETIGGRRLIATETDMRPLAEHLDVGHTIGLPQHVHGVAVLPDDHLVQGAGERRPERGQAIEREQPIAPRRIIAQPVNLGEEGDVLVDAEIAVQAEPLREIAD